MLFWFFQIMKDTFLIKQLPVTASECWRLGKSPWLLIDDIIFQPFDSILMDLLMGCRNLTFKQRVIKGIH